MLVLVPTPELALQVTSVARQLAASLPEPPDIRCVMSEDVDDEQGMRAARLVVATPGSLLHRLGEGSIVAKQLRMVAIDEADALCDGSESDAAAVLNALERPEHGAAPQFIMTMATLGAEQDAKLRAGLPSFAKAKRVSHAGVLPPTLRQRFHLVPHGDKPPHLLRLLRDAADDAWLAGGGTMVFCTEAELATDVHALLEEELPSLHPVLLTEGTPAKQRHATIDAVRDGATQLLVCTDSCSRGLDFPTMRCDQRALALSWEGTGHWEYS